MKNKYYAFALTLYKCDEPLPLLAGFHGTVEEFAKLKETYWEDFGIEVLIYEMKQIRKKDCLRINTK